MKKLTIAACMAISIMVISLPASAEEMSNYELTERIQKIEKQLTDDDTAGGWMDRISISGAVELDYSYINHNDITNKDSDSTSELDIGTAELGIEVQFHEWVTGNVVLKGESLDDDDRVFWDEATISIQNDDFPLYFVGGKRGQPFGVFNSHLINDPITQDCYEITKTGATIGFTPDLWGFDISATVYKGEVLADKVSEAGYGWERDPNPDPTDDVSSYIFNVSLAPIEGLSLSAYFDSEPGQGERNETAGASLEYQVGILTFDAEYIAALSREKNATTGKEHEESAWFAAVACQAMDPLEIAVRYEAFDDGMDGDQDEHLENRYSVGASYTLFERDPFVATLMLEYRRSNYEKESGSTVEDTADEVFAKLAFEF